MEKLKNAKYISLQTFKKNGQTIETPLWIVILPEKTREQALYAFTNKNSGKIKRITKNPSCRIALCSFTGKLQSPWTRAKVIQSPDEESAERIITLMYQKYSWQMFLVDFLARIGDKRSSWTILKIIY